MRRGRLLLLALAVLVVALALAAVVSEQGSYKCKFAGYVEKSHGCSSSRTIRVGDSGKLHCYVGGVSGKTVARTFTVGEGGYARVVQPYARTQGGFVAVHRLAKGKGPIQVTAPSLGLSSVKLVRDDGASRGTLSISVGGKTAFPQYTDWSWERKRKKDKGVSLDAKDRQTAFKAEGTFSAGIAYVDGYVKNLGPKRETFGGAAKGWARARCLKCGPSGRHESKLKVSTAVEGDNVLLSVTIEYSGDFNGRRNTPFTLSKEGKNSAFTVTLTAPEYVSAGGVWYRFDHWEVPGGASTQRSVTVHVPDNAARSAKAVYRLYTATLTVKTNIDDGLAELAVLVNGTPTWTPRRALSKE